MLATIDKVSDKSFDYIIIGTGDLLRNLVLPINSRNFQVEGYGCHRSMTWSGFALTSCSRRQASSLLRAYQKTLLSQSSCWRLVLLT